MSRELKFRAWVKNKKAGHEMFTVVMISWIGKEIIVSGKGGSISLDDCELMQYTGLHDSTKWRQLSPTEKSDWLARGKTKEEWDGKEIYEGDIVKGQFYTN